VGIESTIEKMRRAVDRAAEQYIKEHGELDYHLPNDDIPEHFKEESAMQPPSLLGTYFTILTFLVTPHTPTARHELIQPPGIPYKVVQEEEDQKYAA